MKRGIIVWIIGLLAIVGCTNSKAGKSTFNPKAGIKITNVTVQEMVSGVQGGDNSFRFLLTIDTGSELVIADSLFYGNVKTKVFVKDAEKSLYIANAVKSKSNSQFKAASETTVVVTFKYKEERIVIKADSFKVLEKMYMP